MENPIKMDDLEVPQFSETSIYDHDGSMWPVHTYIYLHEWLVFMGSMYRVLEVGESWGE